MEHVISYLITGRIPMPEFQPDIERLRRLLQDLERIRRKARSERRPIAFADLLHGLPVRIVQTEEAFHEACVHEAGHAMVGHCLADEAESRLLECQVFREAGMDGSGGRTIMRQIPGRNLGKAAYMAQMTILLAGIAAEEIVFGDHADGAGGSDDSDLRQATLIAATMEVSLGLGDSLVYLTSRQPADVLARLRSDSLLRQTVARTMGMLKSSALSELHERDEQPCSSIGSNDPS